jgi:NAD(P)-dependent dehydrogenase (short-subunit alcohol dehydrogenase family)
MNVTTRTWLVAGTSTGIGRLLTQQLLVRGWRVAATVRRPKTMDDLSYRSGPVR